MTPPTGIISLKSSRGVKETLDRLEALLQEKGVTVFARIDHAGGAAKAGMKMPPTELLIFGHPRGGTPAMLEEPLAAIDLPLKALAWEDAQGQSWLSYNDAQYLRLRFSLSDGVLAKISGALALIELAAGEKAA